MHTQAESYTLLTPCLCSLTAEVEARSTEDSDSTTNTFVKKFRRGSFKIQAPPLLVVTPYLTVSQRHSQLANN